MLQDTDTLQRLKRLRLVTKNYYALCGLQYQPFGVVLLLWGSFSLGWLRLPDGVDETIGVYLVVFGFIGSLFLSSVIQSYYERTFGYVERLPSNQLDNIIAFLVLFVLVLISIRVDGSGMFPISATGLVIALWFLFIWWRTDAFRVSILVIALLTALISLLPLVGYTYISRIFLPDHGGYAIAFGLICVVGGLFDHFFLMQSFRKLRWSPNE